MEISTLADDPSALPLPVTEVDILMARSPLLPNTV